MAIDNYYKTLGLNDFCTDQEKIRDAYRSQIKYFHPDSKNVSPEIADAKTKELNVAYDVLSNPQKKQVYDTQLRYEQNGPQQFNSSYSNTRTSYNNQYNNSTRNSSQTNTNSYTYSNSNSANQNTYRGNYTRHSNTNYNSSRRKKSSSASIWGWMFIFILVLAMCSSSGGGSGSSSSYNSNSSSSNNTSSTAAKDPDADLTPVSVSNGQYIVSPKDEQITYVQVKTSDSYNYYVYLKDITHSGRNDTAVYIKGGNTVKINIPSGKYELYYCIGDTWYGKTHKFGSKTRGTKFDEILNCAETSEGVYYYEVTLYTVMDGNAKTEPVDMDDFPG